MADKAQVTSVDSIEAFRARLVVYVTKARAAVEEVSAEVGRTRQWLQGEQRRYWSDQLRIRKKKLERAESELSSARMSTFQETTSSQQMQVRKAREAVREAEEKLNLIKKWDRELDNVAEPLVRQTNSLQHSLGVDMPHALAFLAGTVTTLEAYAEVRPTRGTNASSTPESETKAEPDAADSAAEPEKGGDSA